MKNSLSKLVPSVLALPNRPVTLPPTIHPDLCSVTVWVWQGRGKREGHRISDWWGCPGVGLLPRRLQRGQWVHLHHAAAGGDGVVVGGAAGAAPTSCPS